MSPPPVSGPSPHPPRFRHSVHEIPTPGTQYKRPPRYEPFILSPWFVGGVAILTIFLGIVLQVALHMSDTQNGFPVPTKNVFSFVSTQFLTSFFPTLLAIPIATFWSVVDWMLRWYQPYITLSEGNAPAARSILLDYIALNRIVILYHSLMHRHYVINVSTLVALSAILLQPLAGSLLQVRQIPHTSDSSAMVLSSIALSPEVGHLNAFLASAGFVDAAVYNDLGDPPFVHGAWTAAQFEAPLGSYLNGTLAVNTTAIQTEVNCVSPQSLNVTTATGGYSASATFPGGCSATFYFNSNNGSEQYSVVNASSCASPGLSVEFQPVVFWFYLQSGVNNTQPQVASVYCNPTIALFTVGTSIDLSDGSLGPCTIIEEQQGTNNVTGSPLNGRPYNGVVFGSSNSSYVSMRAMAINFGIPETIYQDASLLPGGPQSIFQDKHGFLNATTSIYTRHLAVAAQANYFAPNSSIIPAQLTSEIPRLFVEELPCHLLSALLILTGCVGLGVHYLHERARRNVYLTSPPGSIAAIVSLTSRSGFGELLLPYDDEQRMQESLAGLKFRLDHRTGAIVAEEDLDGGERAEGTNMALLRHRKRTYRPSYKVDGSDTRFSQSSFSEEEEEDTPGPSNDRA